MPSSLAIRPVADGRLARVSDLVEQLAGRDASGGLRVGPGKVVTAVHHIPAREAEWAGMPELAMPATRVAMMATSNVTLPFFKQHPTSTVY